jgi:hypothetical protein
MHYFIWQALKQRLPAEYPLKMTFLMADVVRGMGGPGHLYGPGDVLTLLYLFHPNRDRPKYDHLAAQALIYNKLIRKEEMVETSDPYPHIRDEWETITMVRALSINDCRQLYPLIRKKGTDVSRDLVYRYLKGNGVRLGPF